MRDRTHHHGDGSIDLTTTQAQELPFLQASPHMFSECTDAAALVDVLLRTVDQAVTICRGKFSLRHERYPPSN